jgi:hypothetical protein
MIKTELPDLLFDEKAFENIKEQINKEEYLQGNVKTIFVGKYCGYSITVTEFKEDNLKVIVINPRNEEVNTVNLEDDKIWGLTRFFKIKTFTTNKEYTKIEENLIETLVIDEVSKEEIDSLIKKCNMIKIANNSDKEKV